MAYDIAISRGLLDTENFRPIKLEEWKKLIAEEDSLVAVKSVEAVNPLTNEILKFDLPENSAQLLVSIKGAAVGAEVSAVLRFRSDGYIVFEIRDEEQIDKVRPVASWLDAQLYGEEGEQY